MYALKKRMEAEDVEMQKKQKKEEDRQRKAFRRKSEGDSIVRDYNSLKNLKTVYSRLIKKDIGISETALSVENIAMLCIL